MFAVHNNAASGHLCHPSRHEVVQSCDQNRDTQPDKQCRNIDWLSDAIYLMPYEYHQHTGTSLKGPWKSRNYASDKSQDPPYMTAVAAGDIT